MSNILPWYVFILRLFVEAPMYVLMAYAINKKKIVLKDYIISSLIMICIVITSKSLPLSIGFPQILFLLFGSFTLVYINKLNIIKSIISNLISIIITISLELLVIYLLNFINFSFIEDQMLLNTIYSIPPLFFLSIIVILFYNFRLKEKNH